jgi:peroxiredoxin
VSFENFPPAPLTVEGSCILHQMFRIRPQTRTELSQKVANSIEALGSQTALFSILGHKADWMLVHFRPSFEELNGIELELARAGLAELAETTTSYVSVVELGLYESTMKFYTEMAEKGVAPYSDEWNIAASESLDRQRKAMHVRLFPEIPPSKYICFYPMDRRRGEMKNWYLEPVPDRARMMHEHGLNGRRYAGKVRQIISGSIGFDDWEWGVDLFAEDPLDFKRLIYEMRFDEVSAIYAEFGPFYLGVRRTPRQFAEFAAAG